MNNLLGKRLGALICGLSLLLLASCVTKMGGSETQILPAPSETVYAFPELIQTPLGTSTPTTQLTRTAPPPQLTFQRIDTMPGMVLESGTVVGSEYPIKNLLWTINTNSNLVFLAKGGKSQNLLSPDQRWLLHIESIQEASADYYETMFWLLDRTSGTARQLSSPKNCSIRSDLFSWSHDSTRLNYMVACGSDQNTDIWALNISTWETKNITNTPDRRESCFDYTPDCRINYPNLPGKLLFTSSNFPGPTPVLGAPPRWESNYFLSQVDEDGKNYRVLDNEHGIFGNISIAPDGSAIAYDGGWVLFKDGRKVQLTAQDMHIPDQSFKSLPVSIRNDVIDIVNPAWSPDGDKIAWDVAHIDGSNQTGVVIYNLKTQETHLLLTFDPYYGSVTICTCEMWQIRDLVWSPDGQYLAFSNLEFPDREVTYRNDMFAEEHSSIWVFGQDGQKVFSMYGAALHTKPVWSPNRQWLAFGARDRDMKESIVTVKVGEWKPYLIDPPFENVWLVDWLMQ